MGLMFTGSPYGNSDARGEHIDPEDSGWVVHRSPDGRTETLVVAVDGREHLRQLMTKAGEQDGPGPWYLVIDVSRDLSADKAAVAEQIATSIRAR